METNESDDLGLNCSGADFTEKENDVIRELLTDAPYKVMACNLNMSAGALEYHIRNIMHKTGCHSRNELRIFLKERTKIPKQHNRLKAKYAGVIIFGVVIVLLTLFFVKTRIDKSHSIAITGIHQFQENALERVEIVSRAMRILNNQGGIRIIAIVGEGGAGKTFLGRKVLSLYKAPICWEINAETSDSTYNSFIDLANHLTTTDEQAAELEKLKKLQFVDEKQKRLVNFISKFLHNFGEWCLLFDNVDSIENIRPYIPNNSGIFGHGSVVITTRDMGIGDVDFIKSSNVINIGNLSESEQYELFCGILYKEGFEKLNNSTKDEVREFLSKIPRMPLDVVAAAYYLKNTKISFGDYEKMMENSYRDLTDMQERLLEKNVNYNRTRYGIVSSVFEEILKKKAEFKILLLTLCLLDSQDLPKRLLKMVSKAGVADEFLYDLRRHSLIIDSSDIASIHRSSQSIGLDYICTVLKPEEKIEMIDKLCSLLTPYEKLEKNFAGINKLIPHLNAFLSKLDTIETNNGELDKYKVALSLVIGDVYRYRTFQLQDALKCFNNVLAINKGKRYLNDADLGKVLLKIGEVCTLVGRNDEAMTYLNKSMLLLSEKWLSEYVRNHRLLGVIQMRKGKFQEANRYFQKALKMLENVPTEGVQFRLIKANTYSDMAFNYFMNGINRNDAPTALKIIQKAIDIISLVDVDNNPKEKLKTLGNMAVYKSRLAGIYNALGEYEHALEIADEAEKIIDEIGAESCSVFYAQGVIARERGLANLRLNNVAVAYNYFMQAKKIFEKASVNEYLFRLKMHEAECLVRLNRLDDALSACEAMISTKDRERNNYCDLFFNTCYYHAAVIKYRKGDIKAAQKCFQDFFDNMKILCKSILDVKQYKELRDSGAFGYQNIIDCFKNSLKIFESIYWKDYEFTKYYVEKNIELVKTVR